MDKSDIRRINKKRRSMLDKTEAETKSLAAAKAFLKSDIYKNAEQIMLYMPLQNETDTSEIIKAAFSDGKKIVFPVTDARSGIITPYYAEKDTVFEEGAFAVCEPKETAVADALMLDVVIVPGIAFDRRGTRVGFGKGCYDRFLKGLTAVKVGFCYEFQYCDEISAEEHDVKMDFLITEGGIIKCR